MVLCFFKLQWNNKGWNATENEKEIDNWESGVFVQSLYGLDTDNQIVFLNIVVSLWSVSNFCFIALHDKKQWCPNKR